MIYLVYSLSFTSWTCWNFPTHHYCIIMHKIWYRVFHKEVDIFIWLYWTWVKLNLSIYSTVVSYSCRNFKRIKTHLFHNQNHFICEIHILTYTADDSWVAICILTLLTLNYDWKGQSNTDNSRKLMYQYCFYVFN